jgi:hypothetical protein
VDLPGDLDARPFLGFRLPSGHVGILHGEKGLTRGVTRCKI